MRIGIGYDVHRLVPNRALILGGIEIPYEKGLRGHSDADVLTHALCDAMLGAGGLGDIGVLFPDNDPEFKDISSIILLERVNQFIREKGYCLINADAVIMAEKPKISPYRERMQKKLAGVLGVDPDGVHIKATTTEGLGVIGKGDGIGAMCVVLLKRVVNSKTNENIDH